MPASSFGLFPTEVARNPDISFLAKAVYADLCTYRNVDTQICWPKRQTLADDMGCSVRNISYALAELGEAGLISRTGDGGCNRSALTEMPWPGVEINPPATPCTPPLQTDARASNKDSGTKKNPPQTPPFSASPKEEGGFRNPNPNPKPIQATPTPINPEPTPISPEPLPVYQVEEQEIEYLTLDSLPAEIQALEKDSAIKALNPLVLLPILVALIGLSPDLAQALLDELGGRMSCQTLKAIDSPISYFRFLLKEAKAGRFVPRYGANIVASRRAAKAHQARIDAPPPPPPVVDAPTEPSKPSKYVPGSLRALLLGYAPPKADA